MINFGEFYAETILCFQI